MKYLTKLKILFCCDFIRFQQSVKDSELHTSSFILDLNTLQVIVGPWCSRYHYCTSLFLHDLNYGSAQVQILPAVCRGFAMVRIAYKSTDLKYG